VTRYYTLVTALPNLPALAKCKQLPISRIALDRRLTMLSDEDLLQLQLAEKLYHQSELSLENLPDKPLVLDWQRQLEKITSQPIQERIRLRLAVKDIAQKTFMALGAGQDSFAVIGTTLYLV